MSDWSDYFYDSADGLRLYCRAFSAQQSGALPVLCLHGLTRNSRDFVDLATHLRARYEVLAADQRGRGRSAWDPDPSRYEIATYVRDMWSLLDARGVKRVITIGTSLGALMSMVMMAQRADRIAGAVLNDAGPELDPAGVRRIAGYTGKLPPVSNWAEAATQTRSVYGSALPGLSDWMEYAHRGYRENDAGIPVPDFDPRIAEAFKNPPKVTPDLWPLFATLKTVPLLVIRGVLSDILSAATVQRMAHEHPRLTHVTVANRGHAPLLDEPEAVSAIDAFLARCAQSQSGRTHHG